MKTRSQGVRVVVVMKEEVTGSPPPPANTRYDELFADAKELEAVLANVTRPGVRLCIYKRLFTNYHKECEFLQRLGAGGDLALALFDFICEHVVKYISGRTPASFVSVPCVEI
jgi:hypothetical protein